MNERYAEYRNTVNAFRLPRYQEIPNVGLYLEQASKYVSGCLNELGDFSLTPSMISNYVKRGLLPSPQKKQYSREQIAYLMFIAVGKSVLSLDALNDFLRLMENSFPTDRAYNRFCQEFEDILRFTFELADTIEVRGEDTCIERRLLYTCVVSAVQKIYIEKNLEILAAERKESQ